MIITSGKKARKFPKGTHQNMERISHDTKHRHPNGTD